MNTHAYAYINDFTNNDYVPIVSTASTKVYIML